METIKIGSKGDSVRVLQRALSITIDGVFGPNTEKSVKKFLSEHKLTVDGIVGDKTWQALGIRDSKCIGNGVIYKPLPVHITKYARVPKYIAIHFTGSSNSKPGRALSTYNTFMTRSASADFCVDDLDIVQFNPDIKSYYCWAVGDTYKASKGGGALNGKATNRNTISIEVCSTCVPSTLAAVSKGNHKGWSFTDKVLDNAVKLTKMLMKMYNIPIDRVVRHYDITGKVCPGIIGWNDEALYDETGKKISGYSNSQKWLEFKQRLA